MARFKLNRLSTVVFLALGALWGAQAGADTYEHREPLRGVVGPGAGSGSAGTPTPSEGGSGTPSEPSPPAAAVFTVTPGALDYGSILAGASYSQFVTLTNSGNAAGAVERGAPAAPYSMTDDCPPSLAAGATCTATVTFGPTAGGPFDATAWLGGKSVTLTGFASAPEPAFSLSAASLAFGQVATGASQVKTVTLTNSGTVAGSMTRTNPAAPFSMTDNCGSALAAGASCTASITFAPTAQTPYADNVTLAGQPLSLTGSGVAPVANLVLTPNVLDFGSVTVGSNAALAMTLTNTGSASGIVSFIDTSAPFALTTACPGQLAPGKSCSMQVTFKPTATGTFSSAGEHGKAFTVSGQAVAAVPGTPVVAVSGSVNSNTEFMTGFVTSSTSTTGQKKWMYINNLGGGAVSAKVRLSDSAGGKFTLGLVQKVNASLTWAPVTCASATLSEVTGCAADTAGSGALQHLRVQIVFKPGEVGSWQGTVVVEPNGGGGIQTHSFAGTAGS